MADIAAKSMFAASPGAADQGSVVQTEAFATFIPGSAAVIITPRCELENKATYVTLAAVRDPVRVAKDSGWISKTKLRESFEPILRNNVYRWHYLTPFDGFPLGALVDYQLVLSAEVEFLDGVTVLATLKDVFREQLAQRYASYAGRVGTDDLVTRDQWNDYRNDLFERMLKAFAEADDSSAS